MKPKIFALYTNPDRSLLVIFANRDEQAAQDVLATREHLVSQGQDVILRDYDSLASVPEELPDNEIVALTDLIVETEPPDPRTQTQSQIPAQVAAIHQCLRHLAGNCDGARQLDGHGFNKLDAEFGHSLANARGLSPKQALAGQKLIHKYRRQLPGDLYATAITPLELGACNLELPSTPMQLIDHKYGNRSGQEVAQNGCDESYGGTYQVGVRPGLKKLAQFIEVLKLAGTPPLYAQENAPDNRMTDNVIVYIKLFDPSGSWTWYLTEFSERAPDGTLNLAFGLVDGHEPELGNVDLLELAEAKGAAGIGIEIDMHFRPTPLSQIRKQIESKAL